MKRLAIMNEKGGVGKSMVACQFAFYAALKRGLRVLVLDFDQQGNTTNTLAHAFGQMLRRHGFDRKAPCERGSPER